MSLLQTVTGYYGYIQWGEQFLAQVTPGLLVTQTGWIANDDYLLTKKLLGVLNLENASVGAAVATGHQALDMIGNRLVQLYKTVKHVKRGDFRTATKILFSDPKYKGRNIKGFSLSGSVLEFNYGWAPAIADIYAASRTLQQSHRDCFERVVRARHTVQDLVSTDPAFAFQKAESKTSKQIIAYLSVDPAHDLADNLGLTDWKSIAWEVIPFSFVVDWVKPIGNYLEVSHLSQRLKGQFVLTTTTKSVAMASGFGPSPPRPGGITPNIVFTGGMTKGITTNRTVASSLPAVPIPAAKAPFSFDTTGGKTRVLNAIALLGSLLGK